MKSKMRETIRPSDPTVESPPSHRVSRAPGRVSRAPRPGAITVEFALVLPVFLLLMFASVEFARLNMMRHAADNAAYEAARVGILPGADATNVASVATNYMQSKLGAQGVTVNVTPDPIADDTPEVTVNVSIPMDQNAWVTPRFSVGYQITASSSLRTERYRGIEAPVN